MPEICLALSRNGSNSWKRSGALSRQRMPLLGQPSTPIVHSSSGGDTVGVGARINSGETCCNPITCPKTT